MTPREFVKKWRAVALKERSAAQEHFLDLCELLGHGKPAALDPQGEHFCFEKGAEKRGGEDGFADVWKRGSFAWEYKGKHADLDKAWEQLDRYRADLENPPLEGKRNVIDGVEVAWGPEGENKRGINPGAPDRFYLGDGNGRFREATKEAGLELEAPLCSYACVFSDVDADGWPDILVANDLQPANLFMNLEGARFRDEALERGFAFDAQGKPTSAMGLFVEDIDQDGDFDVLRTNFDMEPNSLHLNDGTGRFSEQAEVYGLAAPSLDRLGWGGGFLDADLDGDLDVVVANGHVYPQAEKIGMHGWLQQCQLYEGKEHPYYGVLWEDATASAGPGFEPLTSARGVAIGDPDDDGDPDLLIVDVDRPPRLLENRSLRDGRWVGVQLVGRRGDDGRLLRTANWLTRRIGEPA